MVTNKEKLLLIKEAQQLQQQLQDDFYHSFCSTCLPFHLRIDYIYFNDLELRLELILYKVENDYNDSILTL